LERLAAMAPSAQPKQMPAPRSGGRRRKQELGPLSVGAYLDHYGIQHSVKTAEGKTIYRLQHCLFDPSHTRNESAIIQDAGGMLVYQCYHTSCRDRTWSEARKKISGHDNLARFCEGYDPTKVPAERSAPSNLQESHFLSISERGRVSFNPSLFADHLLDQFQPMINEGVDFGGLFYRYNHSGLWKHLPEAVILNKACDILGEHAKTNRLNDGLNLLKQKTFVHPDELAPDPFWLNLKNCMLNVETMECRPHSPEFKSRVQLPVRYDPKAFCSQWIETLAGIFSDDLSKADTLQEFLGYCLFPKIIFPCALFCIGKGANGKGTVQFIIEGILGKQNVSHISLQRMEERFGPAELKDKLLNSCGETSDKRLEVTRFKEIAAADEIQAEQKYKEDLKFRPIAKHMVSMNAFPAIREQTHAFFRRIIVLEFNQVFENEGDDKDLKRKLEAELNGIFMWALAGLKRVLEKKAISQPESVRNAKNRLKQWVTPAVLFVDEICMLGKQYRVYPDDLFRRYLKWAEDGNVHHPVGKQKFYEQIQTNFSVRRSRAHGASKEHFEGIGVRGEEQLSFDDTEA
jgi:putative DNA primase/helicase